ncbi:C-X-C motif chemokine 9 [Candoia aspera]|uniref:C-X-C motif chemokine 9 n=1 Tax=Candoia aspera TaxID=51853 RepID=UPI002FD83F6D
MRRVCAVSLSLLFLLAVGIQGMVTSLKNHCKCRSMSPSPLSMRLVMKFETFPRSASCDQTEYIVTLNSGKQQCLDPTSQAVQKMLRKYEKCKLLQHFGMENWYFYIALRLQWLL